MKTTPNTPKTNAVFKAMCELPFGSMVEVPSNYPPCDPWELARELEIENIYLKAELKKLQELKSDSGSLASSAPQILKNGDGEEDD